MGDNFTYTGQAPAEHTKTKFGIRGCVTDLIVRSKFYKNQLRGFCAVRGQTWGLPLT